MAALRMVAAMSGASDEVKRVVFAHLELEQRQLDIELAEATR